jgi:hypothetical protein
VGAAKSAEGIESVPAVTKPGKRKMAAKINRRLRIMELGWGGMDD